ncbi:hypothetical protein GP486_008852, partial [Trichoglossum hirsutum]
MAKTKPNGKKPKKKRKSFLNTVAPSPVGKRPPASRSWNELLEDATTLLHAGQADEALRPAQDALSLLEASSATPQPSSRSLPALKLLAEIHVELGELEAARMRFQQAAELDPDGAVAESEGGGAE